LTDGDKLFLIELISTYLPTADLLDFGGTVMEQILDDDAIFDSLVEQALTATSIAALTLPELPAAVSGDANPA